MDARLRAEEDITRDFESIQWGDLAAALKSFGSAGARRLDDPRGAWALYFPRSGRYVYAIQTAPLLRELRSALQAIGTPAAPLLDDRDTLDVLGARRPQASGIPRQLAGAQPLRPGRAVPFEQGQPLEVQLRTDYILADFSVNGARTRREDVATAEEHPDARAWGGARRFRVTRFAPGDDFRSTHRQLSAAELATLPMGDMGLGPPPGVELPPPARYRRVLRVLLALLPPDGNHGPRSGGAALFQRAKCLSEAADIWGRLRWKGAEMRPDLDNNFWRAESTYDDLWTTLRKASNSKSDFQRDLFELHPSGAVVLSDVSYGAGALRKLWEVSVAGAGGPLSGEAMSFICSLPDMLGLGADVAELAAAIARLAEGELPSNWREVEAAWAAALREAVQLLGPSWTPPPRLPTFLPHRSAPCPSGHSPTARHAVFISYNQASESGLADRLVVAVDCALAEAGRPDLKCFANTACIPSGMKWKDEIARALREAAVLLLLVSGPLLDKLEQVERGASYTLREVHWALGDAGVPVLPVAIGPGPDHESLVRRASLIQARDPKLGRRVCDVLKPLRSVQWAEVDPDRPQDAASLAQTVATFVLAALKPAVNLPSADAAQGAAEDGTGSLLDHLRNLTLSQVESVRAGAAAFELYVHAAIVRHGWQSEPENEAVRKCFRRMQSDLRALTTTEDAGLEAAVLLAVNADQLPPLDDRSWSKDKRVVEVQTRLAWLQARPPNPANLPRPDIATLGRLYLDGWRFAAWAVLLGVDGGYTLHRSARNT